MSFGKSRVERFPSYSHGSGPLASVKMNDNISFRVQSSFCTAASSSVSPNRTTRSQCTPPKRLKPPNFHRAGIYKSLNSRGRNLSNPSSNHSKAVSSTICCIKKKQSPIQASNGNRTSTPIGKLKAIQACTLLTPLKPANIKSVRTKLWANEIDVMSNEVFATPPCSPPKDLESTKDEEAMPENQVVSLNNHDEETTVADVADPTVIETQPFSPSETADISSSQLHQVVILTNPSPNEETWNSVISSAEITTATTSGRNPRLRISGRSASNSPIVPMSRGSNYGVNGRRRNSSPAGIVTSEWTANHGFLQDSTLQRSLIADESDSSFVPIASSAMWSSGEVYYPPPPSFPQTPSSRSSIRDGMRGSMRQEVLLAFEDLRENINQLNSSFRQNVNGTPRTRASAENLPFELQEILNSDIDCRNSVTLPWYKRFVERMFGKRASTSFSAAGLNYFSSGSRNSSSRRTSSGNLEMQSRTPLPRWVLHNFFHFRRPSGDSIRLYLRNDGRQTVRRIRLYVGPATIDVVRDPQFWMPALEFVLGQLLEITFRW